MIKSCTREDVIMLFDQEQNISKLSSEMHEKDVIGYILMDIPKDRHFHECNVLSSIKSYS
jgi:hypothetical protein